MIVGLIVPDLGDQFYAKCAHTLQQIARSRGYMTLIVSSERDSTLEIQEAKLMADRKIAGMIIVTSATEPDPRLHQLQETGLEIVAMTRPIRGMNTDVVVIEDSGRRA